MDNERKVAERAAAINSEIEGMGWSTFTVDDDLYSPEAVNAIKEYLDEQKKVPLMVSATDTVHIRIRNDDEIQRLKGIVCNQEAALNHWRKAFDEEHAALLAEKAEHDEVTDGWEDLINEYKNTWHDVLGTYLTDIVKQREAAYSSALTWAAAADKQTMGMCRDIIEIRKQLVQSERDLQSQRESDRSLRDSNREGWYRANRAEATVVSRDKRITRLLAHIERKDREIVAAKKKRDNGNDTLYNSLVDSLNEGVDATNEIEELKTQLADITERYNRSEDRNKKSVQLNGRLSHQYARLRTAIRDFGAEVNGDLAPRKAFFDLVDVVDGLDEERREQLKPMTQESRDLVKAPLNGVEVR